MMEPFAHIAFDKLEGYCRLYQLQQLQYPR